MTLVIGRLHDNELGLVADWRISNPDANPHYNSGGLKLVVLHPHLVCAYAGHVHTALQLLRNAPSAPDGALKSADVSTLLQHLSTAQSEGADADFLVGSSVDGTRELARVRSGAVEEGLSHAWIGDISAFEAYQGVYVQMSAEAVEPLPPEVRHLQARLEVMNIRSVFHRLLIARPSVPSIGETEVYVHWFPGGFEYLMKAEALATQDLVITPFPAMTEAINAAAKSIDGGQFTCHQLVPVDVGVAAFGLYFEQARYALIAEPLRRDELLEFADVDRDQLLRDVAEQYGLHLR